MIYDKNTDMFWTSGDLATRIIVYNTIYVSKNTSDTIKHYAYVTDHTITIKNLKWDTKYYYIIKSTDVNGNTAAVGPFTFTTEEKPKGQKFALLIGEGGTIKVGYPGIFEIERDTERPIKRDLCSLHKLLKNKGYEIIGHEYNFGATESQIIGENGLFKDLNDRLRTYANQGIDDNVVLVFFAGHGSENGDFGTNNGKERTTWETIHSELTTATLDRNGDGVVSNYELNNPMYKYLIIVVAACHSRYAKDELLPKTASGLWVERRIVITSANYNEVSTGVGLFSVNARLVFLARFVQRLWGDDACWDAAYVGMQQSLIGCMIGAVAGAIIAEWIGAVVGVILSLLIHAIVSAAGCSSTICGDATLEDAYLYAYYWCRWGAWGFGVLSNTPENSNEQLSSNIKL